mmetsp:Transcript_26145/g.75461  ORF Transcript_26145/g.75461 Transcript_26145/m.75461 type:complete len:208 (+) Transcript_26145:208-831(+)
MTSTWSPSIAVMRAFCSEACCSSPTSGARTQTRVKRRSCLSYAVGLLPGDGAVATRPGDAIAFVGVCWLFVGVELLRFAGGDAAGRAALSALGMGPAEPPLLLLRFAAGASPSSAPLPSPLSSPLGCLSSLGPGQMARSLAPGTRVRALTVCSSSNSLSIAACSSAELGSGEGLGRTTSKHSGEKEVAFAGAATLPKMCWWMARRAA